MSQNNPLYVWFSLYEVNKYSIAVLTHGTTTEHQAVRQALRKAIGNDDLTFNYNVKLSTSKLANIDNVKRTFPFNNLLESLALGVEVFILTRNFMFEHDASIWDYSRNDDEWDHEVSPKHLSFNSNAANEQYIHSDKGVKTNWVFVSPEDILKSEALGDVDDYTLPSHVVYSVLKDENKSCEESDAFDTTKKIYCIQDKRLIVESLKTLAISNELNLASSKSVEENKNQVSTISEGAAEDAFRTFAELIYEQDNEINMSKMLND